jgi:hypothetical protein
MPGTVDPACPLDWSHPLNRGVVGEWAVVPNAGWRGGGVVRDLVRGGHAPHDGTLSGGAGWGTNRGRTGGSGSASFTGTGNLIDVSGAPSPAGNWAFLAWVYLATAGTDHNSRTVFSAGTGGSVYTHYLTVGGGHANSFDGSTWLDGTAGTVPTNAWTHVAWVWAAGATRSVYVNGKLDVSAAAFTPTWGASKYLGNRVDGASGIAAEMDGNLDGCVFLNYAPTADEIAAAVRESRRGNPDRWRWAGAKTWFPPAQAAAPTTVPAPYYYRHLAGGPSRV